VISLRICIVIPAHNEEKRIIKTLDNLSKTVLKKYGMDLILIVVSDHSTDRTNSIITSYTKRYRQIKYLNSKVRLGKGGAIIKGFELAFERYKPDILGFIDADSSVSDEQIIRLLEFLKDNKVDGVIASRYLKQSRIIGRQGNARFISSRAYNSMIRLLFGLDFKDTQCGAKFFKAEALSSTLHRISLTDLSFDINLLYEMHTHKFNVVEIPIDYSIIKEGSKVDLKRQIPKMFLITVGYRLVRSPLNAVMPEKLKSELYDKIRNY
jgi:glycosyltransferase involved in cell wall biosynthesis